MLAVLPRPLGKDLLDFACDCEASQPAKSGSPSSLYVVTRGALDDRFLPDGASKKESSASSIFSHASKASSGSSLASIPGSMAVSNCPD